MSEPNDNTNANNKFDGNAFLEHLRSSNFPVTATDDTIGAGNSSKHHHLDSLAKLFDPDQEANNSELDSIASSNQDYTNRNSNNRTLNSTASSSPAFPHTKTTIGVDPLQSNLASVPALPPRPPPVHGRNVSWGDHHTKPNSCPTADPANINQTSFLPIPNHPSGSAAPAPNNGTIPTVHQRLKYMQDTGKGGAYKESRRRLHADEVMGQFEHEVEANILKAIDERVSLQYEQRKQHRFTDTGTSSIFSYVPDPTAHEFETSQTPTGENVHDNDDDDDENDYDELGSSANRSSNHARENYKRSGHGSPSLRSMGGSQGEGKGKESRPLLHSRNNHRRMMSVEDTLSDLTKAMSAMHGKKSTYWNRRKENRGKSTADEFAEAALHLDREDEASDDSGDLNDPKKPSSGMRLWRTALEGLATLKENKEEMKGGDLSGCDDVHDDNKTQFVDIEVGSGAEREKKPTSQKLLKENADENEINGTSAFSSSSESESSSGSDVNNQIDSNDKRKPKRRSSVNGKFKEDWEILTEFFRPRKDRIIWYAKTMILYVILPLFGISCIMYYAVDNPPTGKDVEDETMEASTSYILLFCCRQVITFSLSLGTQAFLIDFLGLNTRILLNLLGPVFTLLVVQSKGWPQILFWWGIYDFALVSGSRPFARHWFHYQDAMGLLNESNPSGELVNNWWYTRCLSIAVSVSVVVAVKRFLVGLHLGRQTFSHYGQQLADVMNKMLLVSEVSQLAKDIEELARQNSFRKMKGGWRSLRGVAFNYDDDETTNKSTKSTRVLGPTDKLIDSNNRDPLTGSLHYSEKLKLMQLLEQWEEPARRDDQAKNEIASISAVLRFRKALTFMEKRYPFSHAFGPAESREACIESSQDVYERLLLHNDEDDVLDFETIALLALDEQGNIDQIKAKALIKVFRPDRQGKLTMLDFVKSVDMVYKEFRLLGATIENSSQIDRAFENIFNIVFYIIVVTIILSQLGFDPLALFLSLSSVILAFAFMIGSASSKYFEGVLFILARRPYGIGDFISVSNPETPSSLHGILPWCVHNVTLFETTLVHLPTNERASLSNGSLANSRITNWARSPQAQFHVFLQLPLNTPYEKLVVFKTAIEEYMKARPREWRALNGFRACSVNAKENFLEYLIVIQHREAWQQVGQILDSKANLTSYCQEVARQLGLHYEAPRLPVDIAYNRAEESEEAAEDSLNPSTLTRSFQEIARNKHQIRVC